MQAHLPQPLQERRLVRSRVNQSVCAARFLFRELIDQTLQRPQTPVAVRTPAEISSIGCASPLRLPNIDADAALPVGSGLLVTRVLLTDEVPGFSQHPEVQITLINEKNLLIASAILPLTPGENFRVIALPAGNYTWRGIYLGTYSAEFRGRLPFKIAAGAACYVGDVDLKIDWTSKKYRLAIRDRSRIAKSRFEEQYAKLAASVPFESAIASDLRN